MFLFLNFLYPKVSNFLFCNFKLPFRIEPMTCQQTSGNLFKKIIGFWNKCYVPKCLFFLIKILIYPKLKPVKPCLICTVSVFGNFCPKIIFHVKSSRYRLVYHQNHHQNSQDKFQHVLKISQIYLDLPSKGQTTSKLFFHANVSSKK